MAKQLGFVGLGKMGQNMVLHLLEQGVDVVAYNRTEAVARAFAAHTQQVLAEHKAKATIENRSDAYGKFTVTDVLGWFIDKYLERPRVILLMVTAGAPVDGIIDMLVDLGIGQGDRIVDCGNSFYKDSIRRYEKLKNIGIHYIDCGTSGGLEGARHGACLMLGGDETVVNQLGWLWNSLSGSHFQGVALKKASSGAAWAYVGPSGAGHFVKMVHNAIEYGMDQAIGEGFELLAKGPYTLDLPKVARLWNNGSVVRGWLIELIGRALARDPKLSALRGIVGGGDMGRWALGVAKELGIETDVLNVALVAREKSKTKQRFATKVVSALRREYGGHTEARASE